MKRRAVAVLAGVALAFCADRAVALDVPEDMQPLMAIFFYEHEVPTVARIINCESRWDRFAANSRSSARGLLQVLRPTWRDARERLGVGVRPHHEAWTYPPAQFAVARALIDERGWQPWEASKGCWS